MKKNIILILTLLLVLTGCSSKKEKTMLNLCDKVEGIISQYRDNTLNNSEFISKVLELKDECNTDDYLCTSINSFKMIDSSFKDEIINAYANNLEYDCKLIRED